MPRSLGSQFRGDPARQGQQALRVVVEAGNQQRGHLDPDTPRLHADERLEDRRQPRTHDLAVEPGVESLEVDVCRVDHRAEQLERLGRLVAVRHEYVRERANLAVSTAYSMNTVGSVYV